MPGAAPASGFAVLVERTAVAEESRVPIVGPAERPQGSIRLMITGERGAILADQVVVFSHRPSDCLGKFARSAGPRPKHARGLGKRVDGQFRTVTIRGPNDEAIGIIGQYRSHELLEGSGPDKPRVGSADPSGRDDPRGAYYFLHDAGKLVLNSPARRAVGKMALLGVIMPQVWNVQKILEIVPKCNRIDTHAQGNDATVEVHQFLEGVATAAERRAVLMVSKQVRRL